MRLKFLGVLVLGLSLAVGACQQAVSPGGASVGDGPSGSDNSAPNVTFSPDTPTLGIHEPVKINFHQWQDPEGFWVTYLPGSPEINVSWDKTSSIVTLTPATRWPGSRSVTFSYRPPVFDGTEFPIPTYDVPDDISILYSAQPNQPVASLNEFQVLELTFNYSLDPDSIQWEGSMTESMVVTWSDDYRQVSLAPVDFWRGGDLRLQATTVELGESLDTGTLHYWISGTFPGVTLDLVGSRLLPDQPLVFTFTEAMDPTRAVPWGTLFAGSDGGVWSEGNTKLTYSPNPAWPYYAGRIGLDAIDLQGMGLMFSKAVLVADDWTTESQKLELDNSNLGGGNLVNFESDGTTLVIGHAAYSGNTGLVQVYGKDENGAWVLTQTLMADDPHPNASFGGRVALSGDTLAIGAPNESYGTAYSMGAVYVFHRTEGTWAQVAKFGLSDATVAHEYFGKVLTLNDGMLFAGVPDKIVPGGTNKGAVYLFGPDEAGQWRELGVLRLPPTQYMSNEKFGSSLAVEGGTLLVGAPGSYPRGVVFVFEGAGASWSQKALLQLDTAYHEYSFGNSIGLSGNFAVVAGDYDGYSHVYQKGESGWTHQQALIPHDVTPWAESPVAISGDVIAIGAYYRANSPTGSTNSGAVYTFARTGDSWGQTGKFVGNPATEYSIGRSIRLAGDQVLAGSFPTQHLIGLYFFDVP